MSVRKIQSKFVAFYVLTFRKKDTFDFGPSLEEEVSKIYGSKRNDHIYYFVIGT